MGLSFYNTESRRVEEFAPFDKDNVTMYVCGITPYSYAHVGNARPAVMFDILARVLRTIYPKVSYVRNITDIDDKINAAAQAEGVSIDVIAERYSQAYSQDLEALFVAIPDKEPRVTEHIKEICAFIEKLIALGYAYIEQSHVLFSVQKYAQYGELAKRNIHEMLAGARIDVAPYKQYAGDFVLWKPSNDAQPGWESPWGRGRPGWHIECSAMAAAHLGESIDIHGGGNDLIFPHHENERAQSVCAHGGKPYVGYWMHNGLVNMGADKMSKSLGNILLIKDLLQEHSGEVIRYYLLSAHYRAPLDWSNEGLQQSKRSLDRLYGALQKLAQITAQQDMDLPEGFKQALYDDLNTPKALAELFGLARHINSADLDSCSEQQLTQWKSDLCNCADILGILNYTPEQWFKSSDNTTLSAEEIETLIAKRDEAKRTKDWALADSIRDELLQNNVVLQDGANGTQWRVES